MILDRSKVVKGMLEFYLFLINLDLSFFFEIIHI